MDKENTKASSAPLNPVGPLDPVEVARQIKEIVAEALAKEPSTVQLSSNLMNDLGAESLDFLDIVFKVERAFHIQITRGEMEHAARGDMSEEDFAPNGVVSEAGLERLRLLMPEAAAQIKTGLRPTQILTLFTVQTFVNMILAKRSGTTA